MMNNEAIIKLMIKMLFDKGILRVREVREDYVKVVVFHRDIRGLLKVEGDMLKKLKEIINIG